MSKKPRKQESNQHVMQELTKVLQQSYQCTDKEVKIVMMALSQKLEHAISEEIMQAVQLNESLHLEEREALEERMPRFLLADTDETFKVNLTHPIFVLLSALRKHYREAVAFLVFMAINEQPQRFLNTIKKKASINMIHGRPGENIFESGEAPR